MVPTDSKESMHIPRRVYMVGIGGIGMSALAQLYASEGVSVSGSDREESPVTEMLAERGIPVAIGHESERIPAGTDMLVYSDAVWEDNPERQHAKELEIPQYSYFEALGVVAKRYRVVAVAGTHGKTTTSGMLAKILQDAGKDPAAIIGSVVRDFNSNFLPGKSGVLVVEACEYRDHMLELSPEVLVITNVEWDHTDYFTSLEAVEQSFRTLAERVPDSGAVIANTHDANTAAVIANAKARVVDYADVSAPPLSQPGEFNRENARAAKAAARALFPDISEAKADESLSSFRGSWRRFEYKGKTAGGALVYDDYAHHPTAIEKMLSAAREQFPDKTILVAFHPHLYTRTRDLMDEFAAALARTDEVVLAPIYPAREEPIPGVTSEALAERIAARGTPARAFSSLDDVRHHLSTHYALRTTHHLFITMGAGDIYKVADQLTRE